MVYSSNKWLPMERVTLAIITTIDGHHMVRGHEGKAWEEALIPATHRGVTISLAGTVGPPTHTEACQSAHWRRQIRTGKAVACYGSCHVVSPSSWIPWLTLDSTVSECEMTTDSSLLNVSPQTMVWKGEKRSHFSLQTVCYDRNGGSNQLWFFLHNTK